MEQVPDDEEHLWEILSVALEEAAEKFVRSREAEGEHLKKDLLGKLDYMTGLVDYIEERSPQILGEYRAKLESKVQDLLSTTREGLRLKLQSLRIRSAWTRRPFVSEVILKIQSRNS